MSAVRKGLGNGSRPYPGCILTLNRIILGNEKACICWEICVWERLIELNVCEIHGTQDKKNNILTIYQWPARFTKTLFHVTFSVETRHRCETSGDHKRVGCFLIKYTRSYRTTASKLWLQKPQSTGYLPAITRSRNLASSFHFHEHLL